MRSPRDGIVSLFVFFSLLLGTGCGGVSLVVNADDNRSFRGSQVPAEVPWSLSVDLELDRDGALSQRSIGDLDGHRVVLWSSASVVLVREEPAPAGMVERQYLLHNPLDEMVHRAGASVGPLVIGPVDLRGTYRRFSDPSLGGVIPASSDHSAGVRLDSSLEPSSWDGVFLDVPFGAGLPMGHVGPVAPVAVGGGYAYNPDRAHLLLGRVEAAPAGGRFGGLVLTAGSVEALSDGVVDISDSLDDSWIRPGSFAGIPVYRGAGLSYVLDRGGFRDTAWPLGIRCFVLAEGWRQFYSYRPVRHAGNAVVSLGTRKASVAVRSALVEPGYLDVDMTPPLRNGFAGIRVEGLLDLPEGKPRNRPLLEWRGELSGDRRWDDEPSEEIRAMRSFVLVYRSGGWLRVLRGEGGAEHRREYTDTAFTPFSSRFPSTAFSAAAMEKTSEFADVAVSFGPPRRYGWALQPAAGCSYRRKWSDRSRRLNASLSLARRGRGLSSWRVSWKVGAEEADHIRRWSHTLSMDAELGTAVTVTVRLALDDTGTPEESWSGLVRLGWYRRGTLGGEPFMNSPP